MKKHLDLVSEASPMMITLFVFPTHPLSSHKRLRDVLLIGAARPLDDTQSGSTTSRTTAPRVPVPLFTSAMLGPSSPAMDQSVALARWILWLGTSLAGMGGVGWIPEGEGAEAARKKTSGCVLRPPWYLAL